MCVRSRIIYNPSIKQSLVSIFTMLGIIISLGGAAITNNIAVKNHICLPLLVISVIAYIIEAIDGRFIAHTRVASLNINIIDRETKSFKLIYESTGITDKIEKIITDAKDVYLIISEFKIRIADSNGDKLVDIMLDDDKEFVKTVKFFYEELGLRLASCN